MKQTFVVFVLTIVASCATPQKNDTVIMKISETEGHIMMKAHEVKPKDRVLLFKNVCKSDPEVAIRGETICEKVIFGEGVITRILNENYFVLKVNPGVAFEEGTSVEKVK